MRKINKSQNSRSHSVVITTLAFLFMLIIKSAWAEQQTDTSEVTTTAVEGSSPSSVQSKSNEITPPISLTKQHKEDLEHYMSGEQVKPLLAGPDEYITLFKKNTSPNSKGIAILIPEWWQGATNPKAISFLRNKLPTQGWNTISVQPNNKPKGFPSTAVTVEEQKKENEIIITEYKRKLSTLFNAVMNTAKDYPGIVLVIAQGNNAALLIEIFNDEDIQLPNAIILLSSYRQTNHKLADSVNEHFSHQLALTELPVLDLYLKHDNAMVLSKAPHRKLIAKQEVKSYYRQRQLQNTITGYYPEKELISQINGWLKAIGW